MSEQTRPIDSLALASLLVSSQFPHMSQTDMQFNIGRIEGSQLRGIDVVGGGDRILVTEGSSRDSERLVMQKLGHSAVLHRVADEGLVSIYNVSHGSRLLVKTLNQSPYGEHYMRKLVGRAGLFMKALHAIDPGMFGIDITSIALTHNDKIDDETSEDDTFLTVIPPLKAPGVAAKISIPEIFTANKNHLSKEQQVYLFAGLNGSADGK